MSAAQALASALAALRRLDDPAVVVSTVPPEALSALAARIDAADPATVPLRGTTFSVKDNIDVEGLVTTAGCPSYGSVAARSATVVERLVAAGALPVAKTNLDQFATGLVGTRSPYGTPRNPFDPTLVPGGSSSGSAVSVARRIVDFSLGTDTAGSGRVPAAMCGIVGLKPTRGWLSTAGVVPAVRSIDCVSVFARDVATAWTVAGLAGGHDPLDAMSRPTPPSAGGTARTIGVVARDALVAMAVVPHLIDAYEQACDALVAAGARAHVVDLEPLMEIGSMLYGGPWVAERHVAVGHHLGDGVLGLDPVVRGIIERSVRWTASDVHRAVYRLAELRAQVDAMFAAVDVLVTPTVTHEATLAEVTDEPLGANERLGRFTTFTNLADLCALTVPTPFVPDARRPPASVSLHAPAWCDEMLVRTARTLTGEPAPTSAGLGIAPRGWLTLVVAGAHLRGQPLEHQLVDRRAVWLGTTTTSRDHRLYALAGTVPAKPGLVRVGPDEGRTIEVDVWALAPDAFADFVVNVPPPLCIGTVELADGSTSAGFLCEPRALDGAADVTAHGGWRHYRASVSVAGTG